MLRFSEVVGEDRRRKPLFHIVVERNGLVQIPVAQHVQDRRERLVPDQIVLTRHFNERWPDVIAILQIRNCHTSATKHLTSLFPRLLQR